jgi:phosphorylated CTD-interacting factor 1
LATAWGRRLVARDAGAAVALECARAAALDKLRKKLNAAGVAAGAGAPPPQAFERWRFAAKLAEETADDADDDHHSGCPTSRNHPRGGARLDPAIPGGGDVDVPERRFAAAASLASDLRRAGVPDADASRVAGELVEASADAARALAKLADRLRSPGANAESLRVGVRCATRKRSVELSASRGGHFVVLSRPAYAKLAAMFRATQKHNPHDPPLEEGHERAFADSEEESANARSNASSKAQSNISAAQPGVAAFRARLFALLLRYKSIGGYGFQASVGPRAHAFMRDHLDVQCECFASPLNAYHFAHHSAFPDVDAPFGSRGSFFHPRVPLPSRGFYQANPPFVGATMLAMVDRMELALREADARDHPLAFVAFVPGWRDEPMWDRLRRSPFVVRRFVVAAADHAYADGAAHQRKRSEAFRASTYDTGVFALMSRRARATRVGAKIASEENNRRTNTDESLIKATPSETAAALDALPWFEAGLREAMSVTGGFAAGGGGSATGGGGAESGVPTIPAGDVVEGEPTGEPASGKKRRRASRSGEDGVEGGKKKESKAAKRRRKRREEKAREETRG